ncbi:carbohydrate sulfotransferase 11-like [Ylistrum balloti]|uniref:carbohydrate sulfotransferase 11-like n=1 Tax=Ylistrum balloti TaxID=509963 RepID=UPI0029059240|nr:carbohydrate sulfotransferase 11-like [Ylistrum balloti]
MFNKIHHKMWNLSFPKVKLLMMIVTVGVLTIYCLMWGMTSSLTPSFFSEFDQGARQSRMFSAPVQSDLLRQRKDHLDTECDAMIASGIMNMTLNISKLSNVVVDDKYGIIYCYVPKVGCSNWKRIFLHMTGMFDKTRTRPEDLKHNEVHFKYRKRLRVLSTYSVSGIRHRLRNYRKFMFVREPMERLLSAYRDKFAGVGLEDKTFQKIADDIWNIFHEDSPLNGHVQKGGITFLDFVKYLVEMNTLQKANFRFDEHWERQSKLCYPCQINYDYIGKYSTLGEDAEYILQHIGLSQYSFPKRSVFYNDSKTNDMLESYFSTIPSYYRKQLHKVYETDYRLFNYTFPFDL